MRRMVRSKGGIGEWVKSLPPFFYHRGRERFFTEVHRELLKLCETTRSNCEVKSNIEIPALFLN